MQLENDELSNIIRAASKTVIGRVFVVRKHGEGTKIRHFRPKEKINLRIFISDHSQQ